jgi:hypothetical protein
VKFGGRTCLKYEVHSNLGLSKEFWMKNFAWSMKSIPTWDCERSFGGW